MTTVIPGRTAQQCKSLVGRPKTHHLLTQGGMKFETYVEVLEKSEMSVHVCMVGGECAHSSLAIRLATVVRASARCAQLLLQLTESPPFSVN